MLTSLWWHRCQQRQNYFPAWKKPEKEKKKWWRKGYEAPVCTVFPAIREKISLCFVLLSGCDILHCFPFILSYPVLKAMAISHKYFRGRLLAVLKAASIGRQQQLCPQGFTLAVPQDIEWLLGSCCWLLESYCRVNATLSAFCTL